MRITHIDISHFRNFKKVSLDIEEQIYYIFSPNGAGKTNFLEALMCVTQGRSSRAKSVFDLISLQSVSNFTRVRSIIEKDEIYINHLFEIDTVQRKKNLYHNNKKCSITKFVGRVPSIWFSPDVMKIINTSPAKKRDYIDNLIEQLSPSYYVALRSYKRSLKNRNKLLEKYDKKYDLQMKIWTENLVQYGVKIIEERKIFFELLNNELEKLSNQNSRYRFRIRYIPSIHSDDIFDEDLNYTYLQKLREFFDIDLEKKTTTKGIHRDLWEIYICVLPNNDFIKLSDFGSRGQQRVGMLFLQMSIAELFKNRTGNYPILLFDDIFSELDKENENMIINFILQKQIQTFITGVESNLYSNHKIARINLQEDARFLRYL